MNINPIRASAAIEESYRSYLTTIFGFAETGLQQQFYEQLLKPERLLKGPILEATPHFKCGSTIEELIIGGSLSENFRHLRTPSLPLDRLLYKHQEISIRKLIERRRNIVVSTGTGSGKTETFMIPIINHMMREHEAGTLCPGVRALLLYPMNALANDQMVRLRSLLENYQEITFGRYTGETEREYGKALEKYRDMYHSDPIPNELISRQQMWDTPPNILLTNYAMLEYLLLRPDDSIFFEGSYEGHWQFIVMDEVHTYSGAKGIEMAMLLRRLKDRIVKDPSKKLQCIATSATLGSGREDFAQIANFATQMFGEPFEWIENNTGRQDVIEGQRIPMTHSVISWGKPDITLYSCWLDILVGGSPKDIIDELAAVALEKDVPEIVVEHAREEANRGDYRFFIHYVLRGDTRLLNLQKELQGGPRLLAAIAEDVIGNIENSTEILVALVELASRAKADESSLPLLPARYHVFVRAIEGAYIGLLPDRKIYLEKHESKNINETNYAVFETA
ncbi:MAG: DEAD/DEAH box helicase, partial [Clostridiales bacterium]|nr:DEAD/DEAH box helicase [Clostridiales bacterium]